MKNILFTFIAVLVFQFGSNAQSSEYKHTFTLNAGASVVGSFVNVLDGLNLDDLSTERAIDGITNLRGQFTGNTTPVLSFSYDYGLKDWFSVGVSGAYQHLEGNIQSISYTREADDTSVRITSANFDIDRVNISARALFHYGTKARLDMYSGFRLGISNWGTVIDASDEVFEEDLKTSNISGLFPAIQFIPFALRGYVTENIGINFETGIGPPQWISVGINCRL